MIPNSWQLKWYTDTFGNTTFKKVTFYFISILQTIHYLRINMADKMYLLLGHKCYYRNGWEVYLNRFILHAIFRITLQHSGFYCDEAIIISSPSVLAWGATSRGYGVDVTSSPLRGGQTAQFVTATTDKISIHLVQQFFSLLAFERNV